MKYPGSILVVTGGSSGLGLATVTLLLRRGARVVILDVNAPPTLPDSACYPGRCDVTDEQNVDTMLRKGLETVAGEGWHLRGAICCAGLGTPGPVLKANGDFGLSVQNFDRDLRINLTGSFIVSRLVASIMAKTTPADGKDGERGAIVLTASIAGYDGQPRMISYDAAKGGTIAMVLPLARDLAAFGIRANAIAPGTFDTPLFRTQPQRVKDGMLEDMVWPKRFGDPDEYASMICTILESKYLNGEVIRLDGGYRIRPRL
ncbi:3-hydroxyacyl-CoA dehydrogenase type II [Hyaloraphidium curvatum]|nr:3-hydroxyacyl-CoA dehydrogenase type II [Hyaloraphidium curvatum]